MSRLQAKAQLFSLQPGHYPSLTKPNLQPTANQERNDQCGIQHHSHELLMMGTVVPETCSAYKKYNKIISGIYPVGFCSSSTSLFLCSFYYPSFLYLNCNFPSECCLFVLMMQTTASSKHCYPSAKFDGVTSQKIAIDTQHYKHVRSHISIRLFFSFFMKENR